MTRSPSAMPRKAEGPPAEWTCAAQRQSLPEPADCDWPFCGCDPYADKVLDSIQESGYSLTAPSKLAESVAVLAERERAAKVADAIGDARSKQLVAAKLAKKRFEARDYESMAMSAYEIAAAIRKGA